MKHAGYSVYEEFYLNDHGVQMNLFAKSIAIRYKQELGCDASMPDDAYGGAYIIDIAKEIIDSDGDKWLQVSEDEIISAFREIGKNKMLSQLKNTLKVFGNNFDLFFSESSLYDDNDNKVQKAINKFEDLGLIYKKDGAT